MKKWKEYTKQERTMIILVFLLLLAILINWARVSDGFHKGMKTFYGTSADTVEAGK